MLMDTDEDLNLHNRVLKWPEYMEEVFEKNSVRLQLRREQAEEELIKNREEYEQKLKNLIDEISKYKSKDSPFLSKEELRVNSENLRRIEKELEKCTQEAEVSYIQILRFLIHDCTACLKNDRPPFCIFALATLIYLGFVC